MASQRATGRAQRRHGSQRGAMSLDGFWAGFWAGFCRRSVISHLVAATALTFAASAAVSQDQYPSSTVEIVVPFAAGGAVDVTGRVVAQALGKALGRSFVVINRPGANSNIGNLAVVRSKPDGYTLLVSSIGLAANAALCKHLPYDPLPDLH